MAKSYRTALNKKVTAQSTPIPGREAEMAKNYAGGYAFKIDPFKALERFLILGTDGGTYYVGERQLTLEAAKSVIHCVGKDGKRTVDAIVDVSSNRRAYRNDAAIFALAIAMTPDYASQETRIYAREKFNEVIRTGSHLLTFVSIIDGMRGFGPALARALRNWYLSKTPAQLSYQVAKYQNRQDWRQADVLRLAHPKPTSDAQSRIFSWAVDGFTDETFGHASEHFNTEMNAIIGLEKVARATTEAEVVQLISDYRLTHEMIPSEWLKSPHVWDALLPHMPMQAMLRNLGRMSANGLLVVGSDAQTKVVGKLEAQVTSSRIHPMAVLLALKMYALGRGLRGSLTWSPLPRVTDALDGAFYTAFGNVEPSNKRINIALDISGSMTSKMLNVPISCREASAAIALITMRTEPNVTITGFTAPSYRLSSVKPLNVSPRQRLDDVVQAISNLPMGRTDCAEPMNWAANEKLDFDAFYIITDNETWAGNVHPVQALQAYRAARVQDARSVVMGMTATNFSIADPHDPLSLDVVGFDSDAPQLVSDFIAGRV